MEKYKKNVTRLRLGGLLSSSRIKNGTDEIFLVTTGIEDANYSLINSSLYQIIGAINLNGIRKWNEIKNPLHQVNVRFQSHKENRQTKHFLYNILTKNKSDLLNFTVKLIGSNTKVIEFIDCEKISNNNIWIKFLGWIMLKLKKGGIRKKEQYIDEILYDLEKDVSHIRFTKKKEIKQFNNTLSY